MKLKGSKAYKEAYARPPLWRKPMNRKEPCPGSGDATNSPSQENAMAARCLRLQNRHLGPLLKPTCQFPNLRIWRGLARQVNNLSIINIYKLWNFQRVILKNLKVCQYIYSSSPAFWEPSSHQSSLLGGTPTTCPKDCPQIHLSWYSDWFSVNRYV